VLDDVGAGVGAGGHSSDIRAFRVSSGLL
jgi:hypothetical protein